MGRIIAELARHRVAPNVLMVVFIASGFWAIANLNTQFFPSFDVQIAGVNAPWRGASSDDVEEALTVPLENRLRDVPELKSLYSYSRDGGANLYLEFPEQTDINQALEEIKQRVDQAAGDLPTDAETPTVWRAIPYEGIARAAIVGGDLGELRRLARRFESDLLRRGIAKVEINGLPKEEIRVEAERRRLIELGLTPADIAARIAAENRDASAGDLGGASVNRQLRALAKREDLYGLAQVAVVSDADSGIVRLADIARITRVPADDEIAFSFNGRRAVELRLQRRDQDDTIKTAELIYEWLEDARASLPAGTEIHLYDERWRNVQSRLDLLLRNGAAGMLLVILMLYIFLEGRVAFWVMAGIPVAFMGTLLVFYFLGGTINMISMFALIMATGIIVDDSIVVGENILYRMQSGEPPLRAAINGARKMFVPVFASAFTTIASFLPLFLVGGIIGSIIFDIPLIIVCILLLALFECFAILPGHLYGAYRGGFGGEEKHGGLRGKLNRGFDRFRDDIFAPLAARAVRYRGATVAMSFAMVIVTVGLFASGAVKFRFFPGADLGQVAASFAFSAGTPRAEMERFADDVAAQANAAGESFAVNPVRFVRVYYGSGGDEQDGDRGADGDEKAMVQVELSSADERAVRTREFTAAWRERVQRPPGIERLSMRERTAGPPGADLQVELTGPDINALKAASLELQDALRGVAGLSLIRDDTPYGKEQIVYELTPLGRALGLDVAQISAQLRDAFDGRLAQTFYDGADEVEVRVLLAERENFDLLGGFQVRLADGNFAALTDVVTLRTRRGFDTILHASGRPAIQVTGEVAPELDPNALIAELRRETMPALAGRYGVEYSFEGKSADQRETFADMQLGLILALTFIYIILTWVFSSWSIPLVIMVTMPLGIIGTVLGHWMMGYAMSILSFFGVFTLFGIIVNDSIVLVRFFQELKEAEPEADADTLIVRAACLRLRAVLLTSLTTIGGLLPLMFETSQQAQFLIPMAISICFGLAFATFLILLFTPACLSYHQAAGRIAARAARRLAPA